LQWYFKQRDVDKQAKCRDAKQFASKGQLPGRWIRAFIVSCGDPATLLPKEQIYWIQSTCARKVIAEELTIMTGSEEEAKQKRARAGHIPRFWLTEEERVDIISETVRAFQCSLVTDVHMLPNSPELALLFDAALATGRGRV
jgi:hypothetical protein